MGEDAVDHNAVGWALLSAAGADTLVLEQAIAHFEAALAANSANGQALSNLLRALLAAGREGEALVRAERCATGIQRCGPHAENWLGWYYMNKRPDLPRALEHLKRAATWGGWWGVAHLNYAAALELTGDLGGARAEYDAALMSGDAHDPAMAHARMAAIDYGRGWLLHALCSARRAVFREELAPRGRLDTWRADVARIEGELRAKGIEFPPFETERAWIALEIADKREGLGVDITRKLSKVERAWRAYEERVDEEVPPSGPLAEVERLLRERRTDDALTELARLAKAGWNVVIDAIGLLSAHGEKAVREKRLPEAIRLLECALEGYVGFAAGSTSGGEGMARMVDVERMRARVALLKGRL